MHKKGSLGKKMLAGGMVTLSSATAMAGQAAEQVSADKARPNSQYTSQNLINTINSKTQNIGNNNSGFQSNQWNTMYNRDNAQQNQNYNYAQNYMMHNTPYGNLNNLTYNDLYNRMWNMVRNVVAQSLNMNNAMVYNIYNSMYNIMFNAMYQDNLMMYNSYSNLYNQIWNKAQNSFGQIVNNTAVVSMYNIMFNNMFNMFSAIQRYNMYYNNMMYNNMGYNNSTTNNNVNTSNQQQYQMRKNFNGDLKKQNLVLNEDTFKQVEDIMEFAAMLDRDTKIKRGISIVELKRGDGHTLSFKKSSNGWVLESNEEIDVSNEMRLAALLSNFLRGAGLHMDLTFLDGRFFCIFVEKTMNVSEELAELKRVGIAEYLKNSRWPIYIEKNYDYYLNFLKDATKDARSYTTQTQENNIQDGSIKLRDGSILYKNKIKDKDGVESQYRITHNGEGIQMIFHNQFIFYDAEKQNFYELPDEIKYGQSIDSIRNERKVLSPGNTQAFFKKFGYFLNELIAKGQLKGKTVPSMWM